MGVSRGRLLLVLKLSEIESTSNGKMMVHGQNSERGRTPLPGKRSRATLLDRRPFQLVTGRQVSDDARAKPEVSRCAHC
jgi:hypothetical protein